MTEPFAIGSNRVFLPRPGVAEREAVCLTPTLLMCSSNGRMGTAMGCASLRSVKPVAIEDHPEHCTAF